MNTKICMNTRKHNQNLWESFNSFPIHTFSGDLCFKGWSVFQRNRWSTIDRVNSSLKCNLMFGLFINGFFVHALNNTILFYCGVVEWFFSIQIPLAALLKTSINILSSVIKPQAFLLLVYFGLYHGLPFFVRLVVWRGHIFSWASSVPLVHTRDR